jgi:GNAT superfamily N-acetyltransferase
MGELIPVKRLDVNNRMVTRWVKPEASAAQAQLLGLRPQKLPSQSTPEEAFEGALEGIRAHNPGVTISLQVSSRGGFSVLSKIELPKSERNSGQGTRIMEEIISAADAEGIDLALTPSDAFGSSKTRLEKFYRRFGFVPNKGRNKDFTTKEAMLRLSAS